MEQNLKKIREKNIWKHDFKKASTEKKKIWPKKSHVMILMSWNKLFRKKSITNEILGGNVRNFIRIEVKLWIRM